VSRPIVGHFDAPLETALQSEVFVGSPSTLEARPRARRCERSYGVSGRRRLLVVSSCLALEAWLMAPAGPEEEGTHDTLTTFADRKRARRTLDEHDAHERGAASEANWTVDCSMERVYGCRDVLRDGRLQHLVELAANGVLGSNDATLAASDRMSDLDAILRKPAMR
jgi:hypothetical protein